MDQSRNVSPTICLLLAATLVCAASARPAAAEDAEARSILTRMKDALEPQRSSLRKIDMTIASPDGMVQWQAMQARTSLPDGKRILTVLLTPPDVHATALLVAERKNETFDTQWIFLPSLRRVRKILSIGADESFLGTDFTYADLGLVNLRDRSVTSRGETKIGDVDAYIIQEVPSDQHYYSRIVTMVAKDTMLPIQRQFFDVGGHLWKSETFQDVSVVDGTPTIMRVRMEDRQANTSTEMVVTEVRYDVKLPAKLFAPDDLPRVASDPIWTSDLGAAKTSATPDV